MEPTYSNKLISVFITNIKNIYIKTIGCVVFFEKVLKIMSLKENRNVLYTNKYIFNQTPLFSKILILLSE
ncbi:hypothetical protein DMB65_12610 [Flavobacterium cheongpyeongense]|uniref:Uncharacterized protein n=1 Tax=Flavobacterium cheongpyeongense TaxID=2212651 RepID=A0A2V4BRF9_9FLAO|nr:hypothetical protein DMB65_12610 [Flavobacterium cheongpyeongense]